MRGSRRRWVAIGIVVFATALVACDGDSTTAARRRDGSETGSSVTTRPAPAATTAPQGELTSRIAYVWDRDVWVTDSASGTNVRLTADRHIGSETEVRMHGPDHVTYSTLSDVYGYEFEGQSTIWDVDLTTGARTELYRTDGYVVDFDWSPDGKTLAVFDGSKAGRIVSVGAPPESAVTPVFTLPAVANGAGFGITFPGGVRYDDQRIKWFPDGTRLLVVYPVVNYSPDPVRLPDSLFVLETSGAVIGSRPAGGADWVTGSLIVVSSVDPKGPLELFDVAHKVSRRLVTRGGATRPRVSSDHNLIVYDGGSSDPSSFVYDLEDAEERRLGDGVAPLWLDAEHVVIGSVSRECPPTPMTPCGPPWSAAGTSRTIAVSSGAVGEGGAASTLVADAWTGVSASSVAVTSAMLPPLSGDGITTASRAGYAGFGPLTIGTLLADVDVVTRSRVSPLTCEYALTPPLESGLMPGDVYFYTDRDHRVTGIGITTPLVSTISGIHVGSTEADVMRTYGNVQRNEYGSQTSALVITNPEGRRVYFRMSKGVVSSILVAESAQSVVDQGQC